VGSTCPCGCQGVLKIHNDGSKNKLSNLTYNHGSQLFRKNQITSHKIAKIFFGKEVELCGSLITK
jgi:hypothetical protein